MKKNFKKLICIFISSFMLFAGFSEESSKVALSAFVEGCRAYSEGKWQDSVFMLKKAVSYEENNNPEAYYMLISAELYANENQSALVDCNYFNENFADSLYSAQVKFLKGRILYNLGEYENCIVELSDFCHQNETHDMYPAALYWIGEALFACEKYDEAQAVFERLINDYPDNPKVAAAQYKIESIAQRAREEKLLYLLKQTGEEYLAAKEDYEKQLRLYNSDSLVKQKLTEEQKKNQTLEEKVRLLQEQVEQLQKENEAQRLLLQKIDGFENNAAADTEENNVISETENSENKTDNQTDNKSSELSAQNDNLNVSVQTDDVSDAAVEITENESSTEKIQTSEGSDKPVSVDSVKMLKEKALQAQKFLDSKTEKAE